MAVPAFTWSPRRREFVHRNHKPVRVETLRALVMEASVEAGRRLSVFGEKVRTNNISAATFRMAMFSDLKNLHFGLGAIAAGGVSQLNTKQLRVIEREFRTQLEHLNDFATGLADGSIERDGRLASRAASYGRAGFLTFENTRRVLMQSAGYLKERRVRGSAKDGCAVCKAQEALGWQAKGVLRRVGESPCGSHCDCYFEFT